MTMPDSPHVLIVDDSPTNIVILAAMLEHDYEASFATSGPQALELLAKEHKPDLILLDLMMPDMDGYAVCEALKADAATREIPVIFVTARSDSESETRALAAGGVDFIHKPVNQAVLRARVGLHLELKRQSRALKTANDELSQHRDHLEELVQARTRELAQARDAAESASRAKSAFLSNMGHELRTPINHIVVTGYLLARLIEDEEARDWLGKIQHASRHLLEIINDILDYSKMEADRIELAALDFDLQNLLEQAERGVRASAAEKGLELVCEVDPQLPMRLRGDPMRLRQVLVNLLGNAVKFSERGPVTLRVRQLGAHRGEVTLRFEVEDLGVGIAPEVQDRLFDLFNQGDNSSTRRYGGTGLGLALCRRLVALMAGDLGFVSTPGEGSTFWFSVRLPLGESAPAPAPDTALDWPELAATLAALDRLLAESDCDIRAVWRGARPLLAPVLGAHLDDFAAAVEGFELEKARDILHAAIAEVPELAAAL